jgi:hypothetical protein
MYKQLRRQIQPDPTTPGSYVATSVFWDTVARTYYQTQTQSQTNDPAELTVGDEVDRWTLRNGKVRVVRYAGDGRVLTTNLAATTGSGGSMACTLIPPVSAPERAYITIDKNGDPVGSPDGYVKIFGRVGTPPYQITVSDVNGNVVASGLRRSSTIPLEVFNMDTALSPYLAHVVDAHGCVADLKIPVVLGTPDGIPYGVILQSKYSGDDLTGRGSLILYNPATKAVEYYGYGPDGTGDGYFYELPKGSFVDGYLLADGVTFRTWRVIDPPLIDYKDEVNTFTLGVATLDNLILFNPDSVPEQNGGVLVEVNSTGPVTFTLTGTVNGVPIAPQTNQTGSFDGLAAGVYEVDANGLKVPFTLVLEYAPHWELDYDDIDGVPMRLELWEQFYTGSVEAVCGQDKPVILKSDGLSSTLGGQGDVPPVVGSSAEINLLAKPGTFQRIVIGTDRNCRADYYRAGKLIFRGYVQPDIYHAPLLDGLQPTSLTATDGLAGLKDTDFLGHIGQRLQGRRPRLNTVLHALSRCGISLPLRFFVNLRSTEMSDDDAPELAATTERSGYWDTEKKEPIDLRTVVDALSQSLGGTLCQREGEWQVRSALEALDDAPGRAYLPAGTAQPDVLASAPTGLINPPDTSGWFWLEADQAIQVRPAWKSLVGKTDAGWRKNAFPAGLVFSDPYAWLDDQVTLRPINGWTPADGGFPLILSRAGDKGTEVLTQWPRTNGMGDERYLKSPALPLVPEPEACPSFLTVVARLVPTHYQEDGTAAADTSASVVLPIEIVVDGQRPASPLFFTISLAKNATDKATTVQVPLPALPSGASEAVLYVHPWQGGVPTKDSGGNYVPSTLYDPNKSVKQGEVVYIQQGGSPTGPRDYYQAKRDLYAVVPDPSVPLPAPTYRAYTEHTNFLQNQYVTYQSQYYQARYDLFDPVPAPPATGSNVSWLLIDPADLPKPTDLNWLALDFTSARGQLFVSEIGVELRPQQATWDATDNFRADGPGGTVRPTEVLAVYHPDVPIASGLFEGNRYAFSKAVALADGSLSTAWARKIDLKPAPLFESLVFDSLSLREGASRLLTGHVRHKGIDPPYLLDSIDLPFDTPGRRFFAGATEWDTKAAVVQVSLVEIGPGTGAPDPLAELPPYSRITHRVYAYLPGKYTPVARLTHNGRVRVRHA